MGFKFTEGYKLPIEIEGVTYDAKITGTTHEEILNVARSMQDIAATTEGDVEAEAEALERCETEILDFLDKIIGEDEVDEIVAKIPAHGIRAIYLLALAQYVIQEVQKGGTQQNAAASTAAAPAHNRAARRQAERASRRTNKKETQPALVE